MLGLAAVLYLKEEPNDYLNPDTDPPQEESKDHLRHLRTVNHRSECNSKLEYEILWRLKSAFEFFGGFTVFFESVPQGTLQNGYKRISNLWSMSETFSVLDHFRVIAIYTHAKNKKLKLPCVYLAFRATD